MKPIFNHVDHAVLNLARLVKLFATDPYILSQLEIELIGSNGKKVRILSCGDVKIQAVLEDGSCYINIPTVLFGDTKFPLLEGTGFEINLLTENHQEISRKLCKRFLISYQSRYREALQRFVEGLKDGHVQTPSLKEKLLKWVFKRDYEIAYRFNNPLIDEMVVTHGTCSQETGDFYVSFKHQELVHLYFNPLETSVTSYRQNRQVLESKLSDDLIEQICSEYFL